MFVKPFSLMFVVSTANDDFDPNFNNAMQYSRVIERKRYQIHSIRLLK